MFDGDYRFAANQRTQWRSVTVPYSTFSLSADAFQPFQQKNIAAGVQLNHDIAGDSRFRTFQLNFTGAYLLPLGADSSSRLSFGALAGVTNRNLSDAALRFDNQYDGYQYNASLPTGEVLARESRTYLNLQFGIGYFKSLSERNFIQAGIGIANLTKPRQSYFEVNSVTLDRRVNVHGMLNYALNEKIELIPSVLLQFQGKYRELIAGSQMRYVIVREKGVYRALRAGIFYRSGDAGYLSVGLDYDQWIAGISYDINLSDLVPASRYRGGLEFSVIRTLSVFRPKRVQHRICPDYI